MLDPDLHSSNFVDPDQHTSNFVDPDPHTSNFVDPDPHTIYADPHHLFIPEEHEKPDNPETQSPDITVFKIGYVREASGIWT